MTEVPRTSEDLAGESKSSVCGGWSTLHHSQNWKTSRANEGRAVSGGGAFENSKDHAKDPQI